MNRKNRSIFVSVLLLTLAGLLIAKVVANDDPSTSALSGVATSAASSTTPSANAPATLERNKNRPANGSKGERNATQVAFAGQAKNSAANPDRSSTKNTATPENKSTAASAAPLPTEANTKLTPLEPRAEPYALVANSGSVNVRFSVRTIGGSNQTAAVFLRQSGMPEGIALNDLGMDGDLVAGDRIHGANIVMDTSRLQPDSCLSYEAFISDGGSETVSSPLRLCVSSLPVRTAASNTDNPVVFADGSKAVADEILITAQPGTKIAAMQTLAASINASIVGSIPPLNLYQLKLAAPATEAQLAALVGQLNARPEVKAASVNAIGQAASVPSDPEYVGQHGLQLTRAQDVWDIGATGNGVIIAVLDTGIDRTHPDFGTVGNCQLAENDCGSTNTDTAVGGTAAGHGTQVAGVIAAKTNNALGVAGIAPGSKIHSIKLANYTLAGMTQGFSDAAAYGAASVINASFTFEATPGSALGAGIPTLCTSINSAVLSGSGAVVVNAVGNNNNTNSIGAYSENFYPARCNDSTHVAHAGLTRKDLFITVANSASVSDAACGSVGIDQRCSTSNYGAWVDIAAPGSQIRTTTIGAPQPPAGSYASPTGTSFSAPMVSGAVAILKQCGVPLDQIESELKAGTIPSIPIVSVLFPGGSSAPRLDIYRVLGHLNRAPSALAISNTSLANNLDTSTGAVVGTLSKTDPDTCDKWTYSTVSGADFALFRIGGANNDSLILTAGVLNSAVKSSYSVTVSVTDSFGKSADLPVTVTVNAAGTPPTPPPASSGGGGGGGCSVMPVGADSDASLILAVLVMLGYGVRRRWKI